MISESSSKSIALELPLPFEPLEALSVSARMMHDALLPCGSSMRLRLDVILPRLETKTRSGARALGNHLAACMKRARGRRARDRAHDRAALKLHLDCCRQVYGRVISSQGREIVPSASRSIQCEGDRICDRGELVLQSARLYFFGTHVLHVLQMARLLRWLSSRLDASIAQPQPA